MIAPLTAPMQRALRDAIHVGDDHWRVLRAQNGANGRVLRALRDRHLVAWSPDGWLLTTRGRHMRVALLDHDHAERFLAGES